MDYLSAVSGFAAFRMGQGVSMNARVLTWHLSVEHMTVDIEYADRACVMQLMAR